MNLLLLIRTFVRTAEAGSMAAAACTLGISATAVGQNIARLETHRGVRLLNRSPRQLALTERGALYLEQVRHLEHDLQRAHAAVAADDLAPAGRLRIATSAAFGRHLVAPLLPALLARHPRLEIELIVADRAIQHAHEDVDVSLRIDAQLDEGLVARLLARIPFLFCASPGYLAQAGVPQGPEDLRDHRCLLFRYPADGRYLRWRFVQDGERFEAAVRPAMACDDIDALAAMAAAGGGITRLSAFVAAPWLQRGELQVLFQDSPAQPEPMEVFFCVTDRRDFTPKIRVLFEHLRAGLPPAWRA